MDLLLESFGHFFLAPFNAWLETSVEVSTDAIDCALEVLELADEEIDTACDRLEVCIDDDLGIEEERVEAGGRDDSALATELLLDKDEFGSSIELSASGKDEFWPSKSGFLEPADIEVWLARELFGPSSSELGLLDRELEVANKGDWLVDDILGSANRELFIVEVDEELGPVDKELGPVNKGLVSANKELESIEDLGRADTGLLAMDDEQEVAEEFVPFTAEAPIDEPTSNELTLACLAIALASLN